MPALAHEAVEERRRGFRDRRCVVLGDARDGAHGVAVDAVEMDEHVLVPRLGEDARLAHAFEEE